MKILFVTPDIKWPVTHGAGIRKWNILQGLLSIGSVDVIACGRSSDEHEDGAYRGCERIFKLSPEIFRESIAQKRNRESNIRRLYMAITKTFPQSLIKGDMISARNFFRGIVSSSEYSLIWVETLQCGVIFDIPNSVPYITRVLDGDDFSWIRDFGILRNTKSYGAKIFEYFDIIKMRRVELHCKQNYSCVIRCSDEDAMRQGGKNVAVIPNGTDVPDVANRDPQSRVLFVGLLSYEPNRLGMEWFISHVWPSVARHCPGARLDIVGRDPSKEILAANEKNGITVHGFVDDLAKLYETATVTIVPLHAGGGTRLKILESLGRAVPVISTTVGAFGIPLTESQGLIRRDGAAAFASQCVHALQNNGQGLQRAAQEGRIAVSEKFDWKILQRSVSNLASNLLHGQELHRSFLA